MTYNGSYAIKLNQTKPNLFLLAIFLFLVSCRVLNLLYCVFLYVSFALDTGAE